MSTAPDAPEAAAGRRDESTQWKVFIGVGVFVAVIAAVYWFASYEDAGTTMLALASALSLFVGAFLWRQDRRLGVGRSDAPGAPDVDDAHYLPDSSVWPFCMGVGAALALNGLIIGWPYATPGAALLALAVGGFVAQGRRRG